jgi:hypothetical protein
MNRDDQELTHGFPLSQDSEDKECLQKEEDHKEHQGYKLI